MRRRARLIGALLSLGFLWGGAADAQPIPLGPPPPLPLIPPDAPVRIDELRVCADPNNLPFSNNKEDGFENAIARLIAQEMHVPLRYTWWAQRRGFIRNTLRAGKCDVVVGVPTGYGLVSSTRPYYRSSYVFLTRARDGPNVTSLDDPVLARVRVGVHLIGDDGANSPGAHALGKRHIVDNVVGFPIYGDYSKPNPPARLITAVEDRTVDVAIVWGPYAGYFSKQSPVPLRIVPVSPLFDPPTQAFAFSISMGVRRNDFARRRVFNEFIVAHRQAIDAILDRYGIPRLDGGARE